MITVYVDLDEKRITTHVEKNMQIKVNSIECKSEKEFKDNAAKIIKGKSIKKEVHVKKWIGADKAITEKQVKEVYVPYKIDEIAFSTEKELYEKKIYKSNYTTTGTVSWSAVQLFGMCLANNVYATMNGKKVDGDLLDMIQDVRECEQIDKVSHNNIVRLVTLITESNNSQLLGLYTKCLEYGILDIERFCFELQTAIKNSGYDVAMSSETYIEGKLTYKFYDGSQHIEGCKTATKKYTKYTTLAVDLANMFINIKFYESAGLTPELTTQRHNTIGLANSWRFTDEDELEQFIESEMRAGEVEDYEEQTHIYNATVDMLFN